MDGFEAYKYSLAIKMHFNSSYDAIKYRYKTKATQQSYWGRHDKYQLTKIGKRFNNQDDIVNYFVAHNLAGNSWVGDMIRDEDTYTEFLKRMESLTYNFKNEMEELSSEYSFNGLVGQYKNNYPTIIKLYLEDSVSLETLCILNKLTGFADDANSKITETILWPDIYNKITKYQPFLKFNEDKISEIVLKSFI